MHRFVNTLSIALLVLLAACSDRHPTAPGTLATQSLLATAENGSGFAWLPPTVRPPVSVSGSFDGTRRPVVRVLCATATGPNCPTVATFTMGNGPSGIKVDLEAEHYHFLWHTPATLQLGEGRYRIEVRVDDQVVGQGPIWVTARQPEANLVPRTHLAVVQGKPWMVKFRLGQDDLPAPRTVTIQPFGGTLTSPLPGGGQMVLDFPDGALLEPLSLTVTPRLPGDGQAAAFSISPSRIPLRRPAKLTIRVGNVLPGVGPERMIISWKSSSDPVPSFLPTGAAPGGSGEFVAELRAIGQQPPELPPAGASLLSLAGASVVTADTDGGEVEVVLSEAEFAAQLDALNQRIADLEARQDFHEAMVARSNAAAFLQKHGTDAQFEAAWAVVTTRVCTEANRAFSLAEGGLGPDFSTFHRAVRSLVSWKAMVELITAFEGDCAGVTTVRLMAVVGDLVEQFTALYTAALDNITVSAERILVELYRALQLRSEGQLLDAEDTFALIRSQVQLPLASKYRAAAYERCRTGHEQVYLVPLLWAARSEVFEYPPAPDSGSVWINPSADFGFEAEDLLADALNCGTDLTVRSLQDDGFGTTFGPFGGGASPGSLLVPSAPVPVFPGGKLQLDGTLVALFCINDDYGNDQIAVDFNGERFTTLNRLAPTGHFIRSGPLELDVDDLAERAGVQPAGGVTVPLTMRRLGDACGGTYRLPTVEGDQEVLGLQLRFPAIALSVTPSSAELEPGEKLTVRAIQTVDGEPSDLVNWSVTGGTFTVPDPTEPDVIEFTAGEATGSFTVVATSGVQPALSASARIDIKDESCPSPDGVPGGAITSQADCPGGLQIVWQSLPSGRILLPYVGATLMTVDAQGPVSWSLVSGSLPPGLGLDASTGTIGGTPGEVGGYEFRVRATAGGESAEEDFEISISGLGAGPLGIQSVVFGHFSALTRDFRITLLRDPFPLRVEWTVGATRYPVGSTSNPVNVTSELGLGDPLATLLNLDGDVRWSLGIQRPEHWFVNPQSARQFDYFVTVRGCLYRVPSGAPYMGSQDEFGNPAHTCITLRWTIAGSASQ